MTGSSIRRLLAATVVIAAVPGTAWGQQAQTARAPQPPILFRVGGALEATFTDNVDPAQPVKDSDLLGTATATAIVEGRTRRGEINGTLNLSYDYYTHNTRLNGARYSGLVAARTDLWEEVVDVSARVGATLQSQSNQGAEAATERLIGDNQTQVINSSLSPRYRTRIGSFAEAEVLYDFSSVVFQRPETTTALSPVSDSITNKGQVEIRSGPDFELILWSVRASAEDLRRVGALPTAAPTDDRSSIRRNAQGSLEYAWSTQFRLVTTGGVDDIDEPSLTAPQDGAFGTAGIAWQPSERTNVRINGGYRYRGPSIDADISYQPREWLRVGVAVSESIETQQSLLNQQLGGIVRDDNGTLVDPITGQPPSPNDNPFGLTDQAFRQNRVQVSLGGEFQRSTYAITGSYDKRDSDLTGSHGWNGAASVGRQLSPRAEVALEGRYSRVTQAGAVTSITETYGASFDYNYRLGSTAFLTASYSFLKRSSALINSQENAVVLSLSRRF